jgi:hypothetical protein
MSTHSHHFSNFLIEWIRKRDMVDNAILEEGKRTDAFGAVNDLIGDDEVPWFDLFLQTTNSGEGDNRPHANEAEGRDVSASRYFMRSILMVQAMTSEKGNRYRLAGGRRRMLGYGNGRGG